MLTWHAACVILSDLPVHFGGLGIVIQSGKKKTIKVKEVDATTQQKDSTGKTKRAGHETAEAFNPTWKYTPDKKQVILFSWFIQMVFHLPF